MALTKAQIKDRTANRLGVLARGQTLDHDDSERIEQGFNEVYEYLKKMNLASFSSTASVPNDIVPFFVTMIAYNCIDDFAVSNDRYARIVNDFATAELKIRQLVTPDYISQDDPRDY